MRPNSVLKAFDKDGNELRYAIYKDDFTWHVPEGFTLKMLKASKVARTSEGATSNRPNAGEQRKKGRGPGALDRC